MSVFGYQSDVNTSVNNGQESILLQIEENHIANEIYHTPQGNKYVISKGNVVVSVDIRLKFTDGVVAIPTKPLISLPVPERFGKINSFPGTVFSVSGNPYFYQMDTNGLINFYGEISPTNEEIIFNFKPYVAEYPIRYVNLT